MRAVLEACATLDERLSALLHGPGRELAEDIRVSAYTWVLRHADGPAFECLCAALRDSAEPARVVSHLEALTLVFPDEPFAAAPDIERRRPTRPQRAKVGPVRTVPESRPHSSQRPLGRTGLSLSPLVLSGAHGLPVSSLAEAHEAGVNAFFWEPRYTELTRFLRSGRTRRDGLVVVAGTYHYSLSQPGVAACLTAPRNHRELRQNLEVLERPWMMPDVLAAMRTHGERVRASNQRFNALVRQAPGGTRDTFPALLDEDPPGE